MTAFGATPERLTYRIDEAAGCLGLSRRTIYELITRGKLKTIKIGRTRLIPASALKMLTERGASLS